MVMTAAAAFAFSKLQTPIYKSSADILVQPARADWGITQSAKILLRSYVSWMDTDTRAQEVINLLRLDRMPGDLRSDVRIASDESRLLIQLTVEDPDGELANEIAGAWTDLFIQWRSAENAKQRKEDRVEAFQLDPPRYGLARPNWKINTLAGAILGALVGGVVVFALEWIESGVVRRPEDVERYLRVPLLGAIPAPKLEVRRPYLLGDWPVRRTGGRVAPSAPSATAQPPAAPEPVLSGPVEPASTAPAEAESAPAETPPSPSLPADEEAGPIDPTMLRSEEDL
jgi:capsular polysaccharide biosynthesis protein